MLKLTLPCASVAQVAQTWLRLSSGTLKNAHPRLRLKRQLLRSRDGSGKCHENIPMWDWLL
jgi:hypothetical protein